MAFILEDGTGIENANAYVDENYANNYYMGERLAMFSELSDKESVIVSATQLVDISYDWKGTRQSIEQGLNWPRDDVELEGHEITGIPNALKKAVCEAVFIIMNSDGELFSNDNQREAVKESVAGAVAVEYAIKEEATKYEVLNKILRGLYCADTSSEQDSPSVGSSKVVRV